MNWTKNYGNRLGVTINTALITTSSDIFAGGYAMKNPMVRDSSSWFLKLNSAGLKYFDKETESNAIVSSTFSSGSNLVFSGFHSDSAGRPHYWIMQTKESGKVIWSRIYTGSGIISNVKTDATGKIFASCGRWVFKTDQDGYILWEYTPESGDSLLKFDVSKTGEVILAGLNRTKNLVIVKLNAQGKQASKYVIPSVNGLTEISSLKLSASNEILLGLNTTEAAIFEKINDKGQVISEVKLGSSTSRIKDFMLTSTGNTLLLLENFRKQTSWDIVLIKLK